MIGKLLSKKQIKNEELTDKVNSLFKNKKFIKTVASMHEVKEFELEQLQVNAAHTLEAVMGQTEDLQKFNSTIIQLTNEDDTISILYNSLPKGEHYLHANILLKGQENYKYTFSFDNEELIVANVATKANSLVTQVDEISDYEAIADQEQVQQQAWWTADGCLPGGYQHCGGNCGYDLDNGGGTPINKTDECCIAHDRCWSVFGEGDNCCDKELVSCVEGEISWAATGIRTYFGPQALQC
ncbi:hypothetical protein [Pontibacillus halophilus]|uniref:hypothetical protein n=1 Tax=Pontibacillus halophilus TaxID=516704 RepID=UPI00042464A9|nr:hypothetical protein [Pontibacillus halophilus]